MEVIKLFLTDLFNQISGVFIDLRKRGSPEDSPPPVEAAESEFQEPPLEAEIPEPPQTRAPDVAGFESSVPDGGSGQIPSSAGGVEGARVEPEPAPKQAPEQSPEQSMARAEDAATENIEEGIESHGGFGAPTEIDSPVDAQSDAQVDSQSEVEERVSLTVEPEAEEEGFFSRLRKGLAKTQSGLFGRLDEILTLNREIDEELWEDFEEVLVMADIGIGPTMKLRSNIERELAKQGRKEAHSIKTALREHILAILKTAEAEETHFDKKPFVIMVAGVNGVSKTTTIGKLAHLFAGQGKKVMMAAADTFRAAAVEQLEIWANRVGSDFLRGQTGADPSAVVYDSVQASKARDIDILIIDTAGRLHTKTNLMDQLKKMCRVVGKELEGAPHETLLVLDATNGQNAVKQAEQFNDAIDVTGIVLTKLDGTAKGGVIVAIADELNIPVKYIGVGEGLDDLRRFDATEFVDALFLPAGETVH